MFKHHLFKEYNLENDAYWTSGSSDGINCERQWAWCPNGTSFFQTNAPWAAGEPSSPFSEACALWNYNSVGASSSNLQDSSCNNVKKFICEVSGIKIASKMLQNYRSCSTVYATRSTSGARRLHKQLFCCNS